MLNPVRKQQGFSIVELMVGFVVGLLVVLSATSVYLTSTQGSSDTAHLARLNQTMRSIMDIMTFDIQRAGYWASAASGASSNPFTVRATAPLTDLKISTDGTCILYTFDADKNGALSSSEFFGFRYVARVNNVGGTIETLDQSGASPATSTASVSDCSTLSWQPMNISTEVVITGLAFTTEGSQCLAFDSTNYSANTSSTYTAWTLASGSTVAACDTTVASGSTVPLGTTTSTPAPTIPSTQGMYVEVRQVTVTLSAQHAQDTTFTRSLSEKILVRNNRVTGS